MNRSMPGLPVHHQLPEFTQTHVHRIGDAIHPSHPLSSPSPPAPNPSQHQSLFQWVNFSHEVDKVFRLQYLSFSFRLTSLCLICSRFIHLIRTDSNAFLFMAEQCSFVYMYHNFFIYLSVNGHLGCLHVLAIINSAAMNIGVYVSLSKSGFLGVYAQQWDCWVVWWFYFHFFKESSHCSP